MRKNFSTQQTELLNTYRAQLARAHGWGAIALLTGTGVVLYCTLIAYGFNHPIPSYLIPLLSPVISWGMVGMAFICFITAGITVFCKVKSVTTMAEIKELGLARAGLRN